MATLLEITEELTAAADSLAAADPALMADPEIVQALFRQLERMNAAATRIAAAFDAGRAWEADGARTAAAWLALRCHQPVATARRRVQLGRALRHMPTVEAAWLAGDIGEAHVGLFTSVRTPATASCFDRDEALLVGQGRELRYRHFARCLAYWAQLADPDGAESAADRQRAARRLHLSQTLGGSWALDGLFGPVEGAIVATAVKRIEDELFAADWAEAKARMGDGVCAADLARTPAQRRADALGRDGPPGQRHAGRISIARAALLGVRGL